MSDISMDVNYNTNCYKPLVLCTLRDSLQCEERYVWLFESLENETSDSIVTTMTVTTMTTLSTGTTSTHSGLIHPTQSQSMNVQQPHSLFMLSGMAIPRRHHSRRDQFFREYVYLCT